MRRLLFLIPSLAYSGRSRQLALLAAGLPRTDWEMRVCCLGPEGPMATALRQAGFAVECLGWRRVFDLNPIRRLRELLAAFRPDLVHAWGLESLRTLLLAGGAGQGRLVLSAPGVGAAQDGLARLDRWLVRTVDRAVAAHGGEAALYQRLGLPSGRVVSIPPGVVPLAEDGTGADTASRMLLGVGPLEPHKGFRDAVWAFDVLQYLYNDLILVLAGTGSDQARLEQFSRAIHTGGRVRFAGPQADMAPLLFRSQVAWVPSRSGGGLHAALEAQAAGRPVVASRMPGLVEVLCEGETGFLVPPGDKVALARQTRLLLDDAPRRAAMGAAGRRWVAERFSAATAAAAHARLYESLG